MVSHNNAVKTRGRPFERGNTGRPRGARHKTTLAIEALLEGQHEALTQKAVSMALEGDVTALRLCLDRLAPARRDVPVSIELPPVANAADLVLASSMVIASASKGEISPSDAGALMALLNTHQRLVETLELEARLEKLEQRATAAGR